ncbi:MAG TPA: FtsX-like permease family protein [Luteitalea sp.]|nr:FtsX-like permease family protein [Luteitalea sp.]
MALHLLKLIWNRKRANFLIITEILLSFIVLAAVTTVAVHYYRNYQSPLGFSYERMWDVVVRVPRGLESTPEVERERLARMVRLVAAVKNMPEVEAASHIQLPTFRNWQWNSDFTMKGGKSIAFNGNRGGDELAATMNIPVVDGRWFSREDTGQSWDAVVINAAMARDIFGDARAVGQLIPEGDRPPRADEPPARRQRVVGVIQDFRQFGEYSTPGNYLFQRNDIETAAQPPAPAGGASSAAATGAADAAAAAKPADMQPGRPTAELPGAIVLRVRPGVNAAFEERLVKALQDLAPDWSFAMQPVEDTRSSYLRNNYLTPLATMGMVAGFLLVMVTLGLSGVLWQNVTQRIRELGLRRAKGADRARIKRQIFLELALMTGIAIVGGGLLLAQVPVLGWLGPVPPSIYAVSLGLAAAGLFVLTSVCGWYPSLLATRIPPAEALRYE